jgi:hypothetical protein
LSRRRFLRDSLRVGAGAAALGLTGGLAEAWAAGEEASATARGASPSGYSGYVAPPGVPPDVQAFVSRPDLHPPGVTISKIPDLASQSAQPQYIFVAPRVSGGSGLTPDSQGLMILDLDGNVVWYQQMTATGADPFNFRVQTYQGSPVLTWYQGTVGPGYGVHGTCVIADDTYTPIAETKAVDFGTDLHEFLITPEDTALITAYYDNTEVGLTIGHAQEVDIASGELIFNWASYPDVPASASYPTNYGNDYFHINSIDLWPGTRDYLISSRNTCAVYLISAQTKEVLWKLGGTDPTFPVSGATQFSFQHDARPLADGSGLSLFDDASQPAPEKKSWGKVYNLDFETNTATLRHEFDHPSPAIDSSSQGNNQLLPNGGHFVGWGAVAYFTEYGPSGSRIHPSIVLDGRLPYGIQNYRAFMYDWTGNPALSELALVVRSNGSGSFTAYASWNGATEVAYWQLAAGATSATLTTVATVAKVGFETTIPFNYDGATDFQLTGLSARMTVLGRSGTVYAS